MSKTKGQSEIMGLAIVVLLITVGLLIYAAIVLNSSNKNYINTYTKKEIPTLLNNAMLETNVKECGDLRLRDLLMRCAEGNNFLCSNSQTACSYGEELISDFMEDTLGVWKRDYRYYVYTGKDFLDSNNWVIDPPITSDEISSFATVSCRNNIKTLNSESGIMFFALSNGKTITFKLDLCFEE